MSVTKTRKLPEPDKRMTCSNCNHVGHKSPTCKRPEGVIDKVGIEIEGFWINLRATQTVASDKGWSAGSGDASLMARDGGCDECNGEHVCDGGMDCATFCTCSMCDCEADCPCYATTRTRESVPPCNPWEFQTKPGSLGEQIRILQVLYPDYTNSTAGMHVHLSFRDGGHGAATALGDQKFFAFWAARWNAWGKRLAVKGQFWKRLKGENKYTSVNTMNDWSINKELSNTVERRRQINFQSWTKHSTVEFRLLPMFRDQKVAISAVCELVSIVEDWMLSPDSMLNLEAPIASNVPPLSHSEVYTSDVVLDPQSPVDNVRVVHVIAPERDVGVIVIPRVMLDARVKKMVADGLR
mgnify:CR=1 FL=1